MTQITCKHCGTVTEHGTPDGSCSFVCAMSGRMAEAKRGALHSGDLRPTGAEHTNDREALTYAEHHPAIRAGQLLPTGQRREPL